MHWYVKVENQAYGPYSDEQMCEFVTEGRIAPHSLISNTPQNGFYGAAEYDAFNIWSSVDQQSVAQPLVAVGGGSVVANPTPTYAPIQQVAQQFEPQIDPHTRYSATPTPLHTPMRTPVQTPVEATAPTHITAPSALTAKSCVFLIMAEIRSEGEMAFLQSMQNFGQAERIGDTVWLVRSPHAVEQIRNTLSQTLNKLDRLFILDTSAGKTAWFNIGADLDNRIRELWDEDEG